MLPSTLRQTARVRRTGWLLAIALSGAITVTQQKWVGVSTIYKPELWTAREMLHESILKNRLPDTVSSWTSIGANGFNIRLLTVWAAEGLHRLTGLTVQRSYLWIETIALLACCLLLYAFLEPYTGWPFALASLLYWGSVMPLTYLHHYFHPWDKPSIAFWLLALICTRQRWWWPLATVLLIGVVTKYDIVLFPILVFLASRKTEPWKPNVLRTVLLLALTFSTFVALRWFAPDGFDARPVLSQLKTNLTAMRSMLVSYPPLLALGLPAVLAAIGYSVADPFAKACVQFMGIVALILFLQTNFAEFRAEVPLLLLLLPAAWFGLMRITRDDASPAPVARP